MLSIAPREGNFSECAPYSGLFRASSAPLEQVLAYTLSDQAILILRAQEALRSENPYVFPGERPMRPLSPPSMAVLMRRLKVDGTVHGMRSAARSWMADTAVAFEVAESCLAHIAGNNVVQAYQRSDMLARRRPVMNAWANYVCPDKTNVVSLRRA